MNKYEDLINEVSSDVIIVEKSFKSDAKGLCKGNKIGIRKDIETTSEKTCILAEELGHYHTTTGNILDQSDTMNRKQEYRARLWGYNKLVGLRGIVDAFEHDCQNLYDMADYLNVTEKYLEEVIFCYKNKYGICVEMDNYIIYFYPNLNILKIIE